MHSNRRQFLQRALATLGMAAMGPAMWQMARPAQAQTAFLSAVGPLQPADENGICLPPGFRSRKIAQALRWVPNTFQFWHVYPDGGACFEAGDGGWIYVSNSEFPLRGGAQAIRFDGNGTILDAYPILKNTSLNCAGGKTPWNTWLSCEEQDLGFVWECDPFGRRKAVKRPALGMFKHEAVAVDPVRNQLYLTEDQPDGCWYRFTPQRLNTQGWPDLSSGQLEVAQVNAAGAVMWLPVPYAVPSLDANAAGIRLNALPTRHQVPAASRFDGGEGIWYHDSQVYFTTKGDNRVWQYDVVLQQLTVLYDAATSSTPVLQGVDNVTVTPEGDVLVAEDGGDMQIVILDAQGRATPLLQVKGQDHSELAGIAFNPAGNRLYFSSQRGPSTRFPSKYGVTYEILLPG